MNVCAYRCWVVLTSHCGWWWGAYAAQTYNKYSGDMEMVRAVVCSGMFPNVAQCKQRGRRTALFTKEDGKVDCHPSSVNARAQYFRQPWLVYGEKVKTTGIYIRDSTSISDYALLMFGGSLVPSRNGQCVEMLDGYLQFSAPPRIAQLVQVRLVVVVDVCVSVAGAGD